MAETAVIKQKTQKGDSLPISFEEVSGLAKAFIASGYFTDTKQLAQAIVKIQAGRELGIPPVYAMQNINLIRGRLCSSANTLALLVKRSDKYNYRIKEHTDTSCVITFYESDNGKWAEVGDSKFTMEDAQRAQLVKPDSGWEKYPRAMLFSRAISQGARIYCPDVTSGLYTDEEIRAIPAKPEDVELPTPEKQSEVQESSDSNKKVAQSCDTPEQPITEAEKLGDAASTTQEAPITEAQLAEMQELKSKHPVNYAKMIEGYGWSGIKKLAQLTEAQATHLIEDTKREHNLV
jgi:hypothetical protein